MPTQHQRNLHTKKKSYPINVNDGCPRTCVNISPQVPPKCLFFFLFLFPCYSIHNTPLVIKAYDADSGLNALLHYDIVEIMPRRYFHIDSTTGAIKTVMLLDHEKIAVFNFHVKVRRVDET